MGHLDQDIFKSIKGEISLYNVLNHLVEPTFGYKFGTHGL